MVFMPSAKKPKKLSARAKAHYLKISFGISKDRTPEVYDFFFRHLPPVLHAMRAGIVEIELERLEPLDRTHTNLAVSREELLRIFGRFVKCHHLEREPSLAFEKARTSVMAHVHTERLGCLLQDYNILFDMFFTDITVKTKKPALTIDMMDGFSNSVLVFGEGAAVKKFRSLLSKRMKRPKFKDVSRKSAGKK
ncbi:MAG: hypothetical protein V1676_05815 [Candidatus Diapherotrites archaeon]